MFIFIKHLTIAKPSLQPFMHWFLCEGYVIELKSSQIQNFYSEITSYEKKKKFGSNFLS